MDKTVELEQRGPIALVTMNKPQAYNSFDMTMVGLLADTLRTLASRQEVVGVVITGKGKAFCAGGDLGWAKGYGESRGAAFHDLASRYHQATVEIRRMPKPVVAAVNGLAAGGGFSMALACDFRVMESSAVLRQAYTSNGLSIDGGGTFTLPRLVGSARAMEIAVFDRPIDAETALAWGLVTEVVENGHSLERAVDMAGEIARGPLSSFAASKKLINDSFETPLETQLERERDFLSQCGDHPNGKEGMAAFLEKRKPEYNR
jgi:2-(1,2-epoxy-1,2-dihydrophenyl)acetyl-CoA isomerase